MRTRKTLIIILQSLWVAVLLTFLLYMLVNNVFMRGSSFMPHECYELTKWSRIYDDGTDEDITLPVTLDTARGEKVVIESILPDLCKDELYVAFYNDCDAKVYINGELRREFSRADADIRGGMVKSIWMFIPIYEKDAGTTIRIERFSTDEYNGSFKELYMGDVYGIVWANMKKSALVYVLAVLLAVISTAIVIAGTVMNRIHKRKIPIIELSIGLILATLWMVFASDLNQFFFDNYYTDGVLGYLCILLMPFPVICYIDDMQKHRHPKVQNGMKALSLAMAVIMITLHFSETVRFDRMMYFILLGQLVIIVHLFASIIIDIREGHLEEYPHIAIGMVIFLVMSVCEVMRLAFTENTTTGIFLLIGLYALFVTGLMQQITELIAADRAHRQAIAANEQKSNFLASMSHEIRTPINSIIGMNEMILRENTSPVIADYARQIASSGKLLLGLVNDVLDFSKIEAGRMDILSASYDTVEVMNDLITMLKERASAKGLEVSVDISPELPAELIGDEVHLKQIVINLISNAVKYTSRGTVTLEVSSAPSVREGWLDVRFRVADTGMGIQADNLDRLFDTFTRANEQSIRSIEGTGLGLSIVKRLTEAMSGTINVESTYGVGSIFTVEIPQQIGRPEPIGDLNNIVRNRDGEYGYKEMFHAPEACILVVDDNAVNLKVVQELLKKTRVKIETASGGRECVYMCRSKRYDLILMDHRMPDPDGVETLHLLKDDFDGMNTDTRVVVLTANAFNGLKERYLSEGFCDYLTKPVDPPQLEKCVMKYLPQELVITDFEAEESATGKDGNAETAEDGCRNSGFADRMRAVEGMDYDATLDKYGANEDFMRTLLTTIVTDGRDKIGLMRSHLAARNYRDFGVEAHAVKSTMATIFAMELSEHAKQHELAAKEERYDFIDADAERLLDCYSDMLNRIDAAMNNGMN